MSLDPLARERSVSPLDSEHLSASLVRAGLRDAASPPLMIERGWPLAKIPLLLRATEPVGRAERNGWWSFYFLDSDKVPFSCRSALKNRNAVYLGDLHAVVQAFPYDSQLLGVNQATTVEAAFSVVTSALPETEPDWQSLSTKVLNYKSSRKLTVRYRLSTRNGQESTVFGKLFPVDGDRQALEAQRALADATPSTDSENFSVAPVVGRIPGWNALLWRRVAGRSVFAQLGSCELTTTIRRVARCLAGLHRSDVRWRRIHDRESELNTVRSWLAAVAVADPIRRAELEVSYQRLQATISRADIPGLVPCHRDFYDKQLLIDGKRCTLLDLEVASRAEPELDVANFLAHLELRGLQGRTDKVEPTGRLFVDEYSRVQPRLDPARLRWYLASSFLRLACVYSFRPEWESLASKLAAASSEAHAIEQEFVGDSL